LRCVILLTYLFIYLLNTLHRSRGEVIGKNSRLSSSEVRLTALLRSHAHTRWAVPLPCWPRPHHAARIDALVRSWWRDNTTTA